MTKKTLKRCCQAEAWLSGAGAAGGRAQLEQEGTEKIARFYGMAREQMLKAQAQRDPAILRQLVGFVNDMREAWVEVQGREKASSRERFRRLAIRLMR